MSTSAIIRRFINQLPKGQIFSTRELLMYGTRSAVDQCLYRLVKNERLIRITNGLFMCNDYGQSLPSTETVALYKAAAFNKYIFQHGIQAAQVLNLTKTEKSNNSATGHSATGNPATGNPASDNPRLEMPIFATNGATSSFRFRKGHIIRLQSTSPRKLAYGNDQIALVIRALWQLGKNNCNAEIASLAIKNFDRTERQKLRQSIHLMPAWMAHHYVRPDRVIKPKSTIIHAEHCLIPHFV